MKNREFLNKLDKYNFKLIISFPPICLIANESASDAYLLNPYLKNTSDKEWTRIMLRKPEEWQMWQDTEIIPEISDPVLLKKMIGDEKEIVKEYGDYIRKISETDLIALSERGLIELLEEFYDVSSKTRFVDAVLNDDSCIVNNDMSPELVQELIDTRYLGSKEIGIPMINFCDRFCNFIASKYDLPIEYVNCLTKNEMISILERKNLIIREEAIPISKAFLLFGNKITTLVGKDVDDLQKYLLDKKEELEKDVNLNKQIQGKSAYKGVVRGKVVILNASDYWKADDILKDKKDFILVTPMTRPEIMCHFKSVRGFVTDEGGITCHAAIVSRELKIPCVIGTKVATKVLKNGDMVEVDADTGIVRIIK